MKLDYFDLLSPDPIYIPKVGGIISPKLKDISSIGISTYRYYLSILSLDLKSYFIMVGHPEQYNMLSDEEKLQIDIFDLLTIDEKSAGLLQTILNFFISEDVIYSLENRCFLVQKNNEIIGAITKDTYSQICDLIYQRNLIKKIYQR